jgi:hypothetical protein
VATGQATEVRQSGVAPRPRSSPDFRWVWQQGTFLAPLALAALLVWRVAPGSDSQAYWLTGHNAHLYGAAPGTPGAYLYSPAFATFIWPLTQLPWAVFRIVWMTAVAAAFAWLLAPLGVRRGVPWFCLCLVEVLMGNVYAFIAVAAVLGIRHGGAWAFVLLTKITPAVGLVWFAVRREWRSLAIALGVTAAIVAVSLALSFQQWSDWVHFLRAHKGVGGTSWWPERAGVGYALVIVAARRNTAWLLAPAMYLTQPMMAHWYVGLPLLAAIPRLRRAEIPQHAK